MLIKPVINFILSPVGLLGEMGRFTAGDGRNKVPVVNALRTNGQCNLLAKERSAQTLTNFNRQGVLALCSGGTGVIVNVNFVPSEWSGLVAAAGEKPSGRSCAKRPNTSFSLIRNILPVVEGKILAGRCFLATP